MNSLTLGFLYVAGISWALAETCVIAANGNWTPLIIYLIGFVAMFSLLGCANISEKAVDLWGGIFAMMLAFGLVYISISTIATGARALGFVKAIFSVGFILVGLVSMGQALKSRAH